MPARHAYGPDPSQFGELTRPDGASRGTVVLIHGGFWRARYDLDLGRPLAADLAARGYTAWNIEYRRVGNGGGWPATLTDVAAAIDLLATLDVDGRHVAAVGHSAGGHLAAWAASRPNLPADAPGADPAVRLSGAVAQAGVLALDRAARDGVGNGATVDLLGGGPDDVPDRYAVADPVALVPPPVPVLCVHSRSDESVPYYLAEAYVAAAGPTARLVEVTGDHMAVIDPRDPSWQLVVDELPALLG